MFKALFVPQGFLTLAALALIGYRQWTGEWPKLSAWSAPETPQHVLSWDRQTNESLDRQRLQVLKREILDQLERMTLESAATQP